jgi:hypothetical protein
MGARLTESDIRERMKERGFILVSDFTSPKDEHSVVYPLCNEPWLTTLEPILKKKHIKGCRSCGQKRAKKQTRTSQKEIDTKLARHRLKMLVPYTSAHQKAQVECLDCGWDWPAKMLHATDGRTGCEICTDRCRSPKAWEYLMRDDNIIIPDHSLYGKLKGCPVQCTVCDYSWTPTNLSDVRNGSSRCAVCNGSFWPIDKINKEIGVKRNIRALRRTEGNQSSIDWLCLNDGCGNEWPANLGNVKRRTSCPECAKSGFKQSRPAEFYYARIDRLKGGALYMIGITNNTFEFRYSAEDLSRMSLIHREKFDYEWGGKDALAQAGRLLPVCSANQSKTAPVFRKSDRD